MDVVFGHTATIFSNCVQIYSSKTILNWNWSKGSIYFNAKLIPEILSTTWSKENINELNVIWKGLSYEHGIQFSRWLQM